MFHATIRSLHKRGLKASAERRTTPLGIVLSTSQSHLTAIDRKVLARPNPSNFNWLSRLDIYGRPTLHSANTPKRLVSGVNVVSLIIGFNGRECSVIRYEESGVG